MALPCGPQATIFADESSGTVFHVSWTIHVTSVLSSTKGNKLCLGNMNPAGQWEAFLLALHGQHKSLRETQVYSPLLPTEADH